MSVLTKPLQVRATDGDTRLGGEDIDARLVDHFLEVHVCVYNIFIYIYYMAVAVAVCDCVYVC